MDTGLDQPLHHVFINAPKKSQKKKKNKTYLKIGRSTYLFRYGNKMKSKTDFFS